MVISTLWSHLEVFKILINFKSLESWKVERGSPNRRWFDTKKKRSATATAKINVSQKCSNHIKYHQMILLHRPFRLTLAVCSPKGKPCPGLNVLKTLVALKSPTWRWDSETNYPLRILQSFPKPSVLLKFKLSWHSDTIPKWANWSKWPSPLWNGIS